MKKTLLVVMILGLFVSFNVAFAGKDKCTTIQSDELYGSDGSQLTTGYNQWGYNYQAKMYNGDWCDYHPVYRPGGANHDWCVENYGDVELMMKWNDGWLSNRDCNDDTLLDRHYGFSSYIGSGAWLTNHERGDYRSLVGDWSLQFNYNGGLYNHDMTINDDSFAGTGAYPSGGPYSINWTVTGSLTGDDVAMTIKYNGSSYEVNAVGTIAEDGTMSGTWTSNTGQSGTWQSTSGKAKSCEWDYFTKIVAAPADATKIGGVWYSADGTEIGPDIWGEFATIQEVSNDSCGGEEGIQYKSPFKAGLGNW